MTDRNNPEISVVIPLYNEEGNIDALFDSLFRALSGLNRTYEIIFIDDGSKDGTRAKCLEIHARHSQVKVIALKGNCGQTAALSAGFDFADGNIIISMDGDLQHNPAEIPIFVKWIDEGYDVVSGWREKRIDPLITRKIPSRIANWVMAKLSGIDLHDFGTTFKAYRREVIKNTTLYGEFHRFIPALIENMDVKIKEVSIESIPRGSGKSNYNIGRTFTVFFDLIRIRFLTRYLNKPLQIFGTLGFLLGSIGFFIAFYLSYLKLFEGLVIMEVRGPLFLLSILLMLVGMQFLTVGLLGEIIVKLYYKLPQTTIYTVEAIFDRNAN